MGNGHTVIYLGFLGGRGRQVLHHVSQLVSHALVSNLGALDLALLVLLRLETVLLGLPLAVGARGVEWIVHEGVPLFIVLEVHVSSESVPQLLPLFFDLLLLFLLLLIQFLIIPLFKQFLNYLF